MTIYQPSTCANYGPDSVGCANIAKYACKNCLLVAYCSTDCQKSNWALHKPYCRSPVGKRTWQPSWILENRTPFFVGGGGMAQFGGGKYLWGNVPALDVVQLRANEGEDYIGDLKVLFAASGDLRNVVTTIAKIPTHYDRPVHITINDRDFDIVARNALILLILLVAEGLDEAIECAIHVWYSAFIRKTDLDFLQERIQPLVESVCAENKDKRPDAMLAKTWVFGTRSLRLTLDSSAWHRLLSYTSLPRYTTAEHAKLIRTEVTLAHSRRDYRDRNLICQSPSHRIAKTRFREDGLLLPFGAQRSHFTEPNPTIFRDFNLWPMHDNADPLSGWSLQEVEDSLNGPARADIYGKLFWHVHKLLKAFLCRSQTLQISFRLFNMDAITLPDYLERDCFNRIEVSNIADAGYLGIHPTLALMLPLLQRPKTNPHATLITLFMNTVHENLTTQDQMAMTTRTRTRLLKYLPLKMGVKMYDSDIIKFFCAKDLVETYDHIFDRVSKETLLFEDARCIGALAKDNHTIVEKWPFRSKLQPGQPGAQEEFERLLGGDLSGKERYIEWKRAPASEN